MPPKKARRAEIDVAAADTLLNSVSSCPNGTCDDGAWPTAHQPPPFTHSGPATTFIATLDGPWCFEPENPQRMIRAAEYPRVWDHVKRMLANCAPTAKRHGLRILGPAGVGKTRLLDVLLSWSLHDFPEVPVVVVGQSFVSLFVHAADRGGERRLAVDGGPRTFTSKGAAILRRAGVPKDAAVVVLHDGPTDGFPFQHVMLSNLVKDFAVVCVVAGDFGNAGEHKQFLKWAATSKQHTLLPTLAAEEARTFAMQSIPDLGADECDEMIDTVGGICRHLASRERASAAAAAQQPMLAADEALVCVVPSADRETVEDHDFVAPRSRRKWLESTAPEQIWASIEDRCRRHTTGTARDVLRRLFRDWFVLDYLHRDGGPAEHALIRKRLDPRGDPEPWTINRTAMTTVRFPGGTVSRVLPAPPGRPTLYVALRSDFPVAIDIILVAEARATLVAVTATDAVALPAGPVADLLATLTTNGLVVDSLVWVTHPWCNLKSPQRVTPEDAETAAAFEAIPQFLCCVGERGEPPG